jgi:hypothetical protein
VPYALNDRYRGIHNGRRVVLINPADIDELELADRQLVDLIPLDSVAEISNTPTPNGVYIRLEPASGW